jgi:CO/xanthine dehydrogenase Mo-binding subunit
MFGFIVQGAKLKINPVTGAVQLLDVYNVTEAGNIINPTMMAGQIFGGVAMSAGYALTEQIRYRDGRSLETNFSNYILPTAVDAPRMVNEDVPAYEETGPYGAKGIAEASTVALAPAIAAALKQLCPSLNATRLPIDREEVLEAIEASAAL